MKLFGTDGVRARPGEFPLIPEVIRKIGYLAGALTEADRVIVGMDTRSSSLQIEEALISGIAAAGVKVLRVGVVTTPGICYIGRKMKALSAVITASHNPYYENGIKFFSADGYKLSEEIEREIERKIEGCKVKDGKSKIEKREELVEDYRAFLKKRGCSLSGLKIVADCANGAGYKIFPEVLRELSADVIEIGTEPDGVNINKKCGALYPERMADVVRKMADVGFSLDGDGDRVIAADRKQIYDGDQIMAIFANHFGVNKVVATEMSNIGLEKALRASQIELIRTDVGDRWVAQKMKEENALLGGEQSGHIILAEHTTTGDGILTALFFLKVLRERGSVAGLRFTPSPQVTVNVEVPEKPPLSEIPGLVEKIEEKKAELSEKGRVFVRYSGTEMCIRIMVEAESPEEIAEDIAEVVRRWRR
jgi:phosphoglucosamine mutase